MAETKKTGKAILRAVDGRKASGACQYSVDSKGMDLSVSAQVMDGGAALEAVLQSGPDKGYRCRPGEGIGGPIRCREPGVMAVWVTDAGKPVLFGQLVPGTFDASEARKHLADAPAIRESAGGGQKTVSMKSVSATASAPEPLPAPDYYRPAANHPAPSQPPEPVLLLGSGSQPLVIRRAPRPAPRPPVYSPLWDDVSAEFEKMLDNLPPAQPFNGNAEGAHFAELPLAGAVQCYIGSVEIKGMKVFLQAVPARPFARPAGFDHTLVSRDGQTFWVKYFIQN